MTSQKEREQYSDEDILETNLVKIQDGILVFDSTVFPIHNISTITFADLSVSYTPKTGFALSNWIILSFSAYFLVVQFMPMAILTILWFLYLVFLFYRDKSKIYYRYKYGVFIETNSGYRKVLVAGTMKFARDIITEIAHQINLYQLGVESGKTTVINFIDQSINISDSSAVVVSTGQIDGDVVNRI